MIIFIFIFFFMLIPEKRVPAWYKRYTHTHNHTPVQGRYCCRHFFFFFFIHSYIERASKRFCCVVSYDVDVE